MEVFRGHEMVAKGRMGDMSVEEWMGTRIEE